MTTKPSKVLIIGSGPIIIGQFKCHSSESWNPEVRERVEWILAGVYPVLRYGARMTITKKEHKS